MHTEGARLHVVRTEGLERRQRRAGERRLCVDDHAQHVAGMPFDLEAHAARFGMAAQRERAPGFEKGQLRSGGSAAFERHMAPGAAEIEV
jgi:hypothetical protein